MLCGYLGGTRRQPASSLLCWVLHAQWCRWFPPRLSVATLQCGGMVNTAWVGLLCKAERTCASALGGDGDVAGATCMQHIALATLLQEFYDVF